MKSIMLLTLFLAAGCAQPSGDDGGVPSLADSAREFRGAPDAARLAELEKYARALANAVGCEASGECRTAPVGHRPCGGPHEYVVYCPAATDSVALFGALDELAAAEDAYNQANELVSSCEMRLPPATLSRGGVCTAAN